MINESEPRFLLRGSCPECGGPISLAKKIHCRNLDGSPSLEDTHEEVYCHRCGKWWLDQDAEEDDFLDGAIFIDYSMSSQILGALVFFIPVLISLPFFYYLFILQWMDLPISLFYLVLILSLGYYTYFSFLPDFEYWLRKRDRREFKRGQK